MTSKVRWRRGWFPVWYGFCPDEDSWRKEMKRSVEPNFAFPTSHGNCTAYDDEKNERRVLITVLLDWDEEPDAAMGVLVHECVHLVQRIVERMQDNHPSSEFMAYATQAVFSELLHDISEYRQKAKRK